jgi:hypothetical protein
MYAWNNRNGMSPTESMPIMISTGWNTLELIGRMESVSLMET